MSPNRGRILTAKNVTLNQYYIRTRLRNKYYNINYGKCKNTKIVNVVFWLCVFKLNSIIYFNTK